MPVTAPEHAGGPTGHQQFWQSRHEICRRQQTRACTEPERPGRPPPHPRRSAVSALQTGAQTMWSPAAASSIIMHVGGCRVLGCYYRARGPATVAAALLTASIPDNTATMPSGPLMHSPLPETPGLSTASYIAHTRVSASHHKGSPRPPCTPASAHVLQNEPEQAQQAPGSWPWPRAAPQLRPARCAQSAGAPGTAAPSTPAPQRAGAGLPLRPQTPLTCAASPPLHQDTIRLFSGRLSFGEPAMLGSLHVSPLTTGLGREALCRLPASAPTDNLTGKGSSVQAPSLCTH